MSRNQIHQVTLPERERNVGDVDGGQEVCVLNLREKYALKGFCQITFWLFPDFITENIETWAMNEIYFWDFVSFFCYLMLVKWKRWKQKKWKNIKTLKGSQIFTLNLAQEVKWFDLSPSTSTSSKNTEAFFQVDWHFYSLFDTIATFLLLFFLLSFFFRFLSHHWKNLMDIKCIRLGCVIRT